MLGRPGVFLKVYCFGLNKGNKKNKKILGGEMAESTKVLALLLQVGLFQVRILVAAKRDKNVCNIGKPPAPNLVPYVPQ